MQRCQNQKRFIIKGYLFRTANQFSYNDLKRAMSTFSIMSNMSSKDMAKAIFVDVSLVSLNLALAMVTSN